VTANATCYRLSGGGNDFLALAEPVAAPTSEQIRAWCRRGISLGADGVFCLHRSSDDGVRMEYFNADGRPADLCLNGTRCAARLAAHLGWVEGTVKIDTGAGPVVARIADERTVRLDLVPPTRAPERRRLEVEGAVWDGWYFPVGVPHFVLPWTESLRDAPVAELGPRLRRHAALGEAGANVMFARFLPPHRLEIRSYERGVEAETLACGTGILAAAGVALSKDLLSLPISALTAGGCLFEIDGGSKPTATGLPETWSLTGDARLLARLEVDEGAVHLPPPPVWS
jgi:diaminopimelate epimerase